MTAEANLASTIIQSADGLREAKLSVQADKDKQYFFDDNQGTLTLPSTFAYLPYNDEEVGIFNIMYMYISKCIHSTLMQVQLNICCS